MNVLDFVLADDNGLSFVLIVDGVPLAQRIGAKDAAIPYWLFHESRPCGLPVLDDEIDPAVRIVAVCSCGEYGCACASCTLRVDQDCVVLENFNGDVSREGRLASFSFTRANYDEATSRMAARARSYAANRMTTTGP